MERLTRVRGGLILIIFCIILVLFAFRLYDLQIIETGGQTDNTKYFTTITRVKAARGDILDRNGNKLVTNRASYDLTLNHFVLLSSENPNAKLLSLVTLCRDLDIDYIDNFPISKETPFAYTLDQFNSTWQGYFQRYLRDIEIDSDISASLLISKLRTRYNIPAEWSDQDARAVIGLRYEMNLRQGNLTVLPNYVFKEDINSTDLAAILELNVPGMRTEASTVREYTTEYAAHVLGYVGAMTKDQWTQYKDKGYAMDALVGQTGFEKAFEEYLHGVDGYRVDEVYPDGTIKNQYYRIVNGEEQRPVSGQNVELTIDLNMQTTAEQVMAEKFEALRLEDETVLGHDVEGGAVVAMDIKTGQVLVCASYPTYDLSTFFEDYEDIASGDFAPLFNRSLQAAYPPGSIYKMTMVIAGMQNGFIDQDTKLEDKGMFDKYMDQGFTASCLVWSGWHATHGFIDCKEALMCSCNYFFYEIGDNLEQPFIDEIAKGLGLGERTGVELGENVGYRANYETKKLLHSGSDAYWYPADQIMASIGQGDNQFTPMQMCVYTSTLVNKGVRYNATFLNRVVSSDYRQEILVNTPKISSTMFISDDIYEAYTTGMRMVVTATNVGTAYDTFGHYPIAVAAKTGTAETGRGGSDNGSFVCYAPYDDPQIAIACYGEQVGSGGALGEIARAIMDTYFNIDTSSDVENNENVLG